MKRLNCSASDAGGALSTALAGAGAVARSWRHVLVLPLSAVGEAEAFDERLLDKRANVLERPNVDDSSEYSTSSETRTSPGGFSRP